jgi:hypothetical protein
MPADDKAKDEVKVDNDALETDLELHEAERVENEQDEQQDLNQGMATGTHSTTKSGVNWPASYRVKPRPEEKK